MRITIPLLLAACTADTQLDDLPLGAPWEAQPPPVPGFVLEGGPAVVGSTLEVTATLPVPPAPADGVPIMFLQSTAGIGPGLCPGVLGGDCLGIQSPFTLQGPVQTRDGSATLRFFVSPGYPSTGLQFQAVVRTANAAYLSNPLQVDLAGTGIDTAPEPFELPFCPSSEAACVDNAGLSLWLRARDLVPGDVDTWIDASGGQHDAVQLVSSMRPTKVGSGDGSLVLFDGVDDRLDVLGDLFEQSTWTVMAVARFQGSSGHMIGRGPSSGGLPTDGHGLALSGGFLGLKAGAEAPLAQSVDRVDDDQLHVVTVSASELGAIYVDGELQGFSSAVGTPPQLPGVTLGASDGEVSGSSAHPTRMGLVEILYFDRELSGSERHLLEGALGERYGVAVTADENPTCVPLTCETGDWGCGTHADGCGGEVSCGTFCPIEPLASTASENSGAFEASLVTDRWVYWNDDPDAHVVARFPGADLSVVDQLAVRLDGPEGSEVITAEPMRKFELLMALSEQPPGDYRITADLVDPAGVVLASESRDVTRVDRARPVRRTLIDIPLRVSDLEPGAVWPMTTAVPLPLGLVEDVSALGLYRDGVPVPASFTPRARWGAAESSSLRWVSVAFMADGGAFHVGPAHGITGALDVVDEPTYVSVDTGRVRFRISKVAFAGLEDLWHDADESGSYDAGEQVVRDGLGPYAVDADGRMYEARFDPNMSVLVEEATDSRAVVHIRGTYVDPVSGDARLRMSTRVTAYAGDARVHVSHRSTFTEDTRTGAPPLHDLGWSMNLQGSGGVRFGVDGAPLDVTPPESGSIFLHQERHDVLRIATDEGGLELPVTVGARSDGWVSFDRPDTSLVLTLRNPWQLYPKELEITGGDDPTMDLHFWPEHASTPWPDGALSREEIWNLRWAHQGDGLALTAPRDLLTALRCYGGDGCANDISLCDPDDRNCLSACDVVACGQDEPTCQATCDAADPDCTVCVDPPACDPCKALLGDSYTDPPDADWGAGELNLQMLQLAGSFENAVTVGNEFVLSLTTDPSTEATLVQRDPHAIADPAWTVDSEVEGRFAPADPQQWPEVEAVIADLFPSIERVVHEQRGGYGMFRWPDFAGEWLPERNVPGLHRASQGAHYQTGFAPFLYYMRSGDEQHLRFARDMSAMFAHVYTEGTQYGCSRHAKAFVPWMSNCQWDGHWTNPDQFLYRWLLFDDGFARDLYLKIYDNVRGGDRYANYDEDWVIGGGRELNATLGDMLNYYRLTHDPDVLFLVDRWATQLIDTRPWGEWRTNMNHWHKLWMQRYHALTRDPRLMPQVRSFVGTGQPLMTPAVLAWREPETAGLPDHDHLRSATRVLYDYTATRFDAPGDPLHGYGTWMHNPSTAETVELPYVLGALRDAQASAEAPPAEVNPETAFWEPGPYPVRDSDTYAYRLLGHPVTRPRTPETAGVDVVAISSGDDLVQVDMTKIFKDHTWDYLRLTAPNGAYTSRRHRAGYRGASWSPTLPGMAGTYGYSCQGGRESCGFFAPWSSLPESAVWTKSSAGGDAARYSSVEPYRLFFRAHDPEASVTLRIRPILDKYGTVELSEAEFEPLFASNVRIERTDGVLLHDLSLFPAAQDPANQEQTVTLAALGGATDDAWIITVAGVQGAAVELVDVPDNPAQLYASPTHADLMTVLDALPASCELPALTCPEIDPQATCGYVVDDCGRSVACEPTTSACGDDSYCTPDNTCATAPDFGGLIGRVYDMSVYDEGGTTHVWTVGQRYISAPTLSVVGAPSVGEWDGQTLHTRDDNTIFSEALGVSAVGADQVWVVGTLASTGEPVLSRWDGSAWQHVCTGAPLVNHLWSVWADPTRPAEDPDVWMARRTAANNLYSYAKGSNVVYRYTDGACSAVAVEPVDATYPLGVQRVFGTGSGDVWVVGEPYTYSSSVTVPWRANWVGLAKYDGSTWSTPFPTGSVANGSQLTAISGRQGSQGDEIVAAGLWTAPGPTFLSYDGAPRSQDAGEMDIWDVWMSPSGQVWAVGNDVVARDLGSGWETVEVPLAPSLLLTAVDGTADDDVWMTGSQMFFDPGQNGTRHRAVMLHWDGDSLTVR